MTDAPTGLLLRALLADGAVRLLAVDARAIAEHTRRLHGLGADGARLGAESIVAAALASAHIKGEEQITLQIQGESPRCSVYADVTAEGDLRARVTPSDVRVEGGLTGILLVIKQIPGGQTYRGATAIDHTSLEQALAGHFGASDQLQAVLRIGIRQGADGTIEEAVGLLLESLPPEQGMPSLEPEAFAARYGAVADSDWRALFTDVALGRLGEEPLQVLARTEVRFRCRCGPARVEAVLSGLGAELLRQMLEEDGGAEVTCDFCQRVVQISGERLAVLLEALSSPSS